MMTTANLTAAAARRIYAANPKLSGSIAAAVRKRMSRQQNRSQTAAIAGRFAAMHAANVARLAGPTAVPLGDIDEAILDSVRASNRRLKEWSLGARGAKLDRDIVIRTTGHTGGPKKRSTFQRGILVRSQVTASHRTATLTLLSDQHIIAAPRGYRWDVDANGLFLRGSAGDYHPTASDLIAATSDRCRAIIASLKDAATARRNAARKAKQQSDMVKLAEREGATVCLADSLRAGNCSAGSQTWARRHNLNPQGHYTPSQILAMANGDASRIAIVVASAVRRHRAEMDRGYAILADHRQ